MQPEPPLEYKEGGLLSLEHKGASDTFVFCDFLKPGVQSVLVFDPLTKQLYYKQIGVKVREVDASHEPLGRAPRASTGYALHESEVANEIKKQVFADFKKDNKSILKMAFLKDTELRIFRPFKYLHDHREVNSCMVELFQQYVVIKDAFTIIAAEGGDYPNISEDTFKRFCSEHGIVDRLLSEEDLNAIFFETNVEYVEDVEDNNPDDLLNRSEFLEILMRIAA